MSDALSENPNCSQTWATFRLAGEDLDPDEVTLLTGVTPSLAFRKGDSVFNPHTGEKICERKAGCWAVNTEDDVESTSMERHLVLLLDILEQSRDRIKELIRRLSLEADFHVYWVTASGTGGPIITAATLKRIADFGTDLDFEFQGPYDD